MTSKRAKALLLTAILILLAVACASTLPESAEDLDDPSSDSAAATTLVDGASVPAESDLTVSIEADDRLSLRMALTSMGLAEIVRLPNDEIDELGQSYCRDAASSQTVEDLLSKFTEALSLSADAEPEIRAGTAFVVAYCPTEARRLGLDGSVAS